MKRLRYVVRLTRDEDSDWGASVPDLPGCVSVAKTIDRALRLIEKAVALHVAGMRADGIEPPKPRQRVVLPRRTPKGTEFFATVEVAA